jgi:hypothetical protein
MNAWLAKMRQPHAHSPVSRLLSKLTYRTID